jgi:hypothetical protein
MRTMPYAKKSLHLPSHKFANVPTAISVTTSLAASKFSALRSYRATSTNCALISALRRLKKAHQSLTKSKFGHALGSDRPSKLQKSPILRLKRALQRKRNLNLAPRDLNRSSNNLEVLRTGSGTATENLSNKQSMLSMLTPLSMLLKISLSETSRRPKHR